MDLDVLWRDVIRAHVPGAVVDEVNGGLVTFIARDFATWLMAVGRVETRAEAELLGDMLRARDIIRPASGSSRFSSSDVVPWVCRGGEIVTSYNSFSVAALLSRSRRYILGASFLKQGSIFLHPRFFALDRAACVLYVFTNESALTPRYMVDFTVSGPYTVSVIKPAATSDLSYDDSDSDGGADGASSNDPGGDKGTKHTSRLVGKERDPALAPFLPSRLWDALAPALTLPEGASSRAHGFVLEAPGLRLVAYSVSARRAAAWVRALSATIAFEPPKQLLSHTQTRLRNVPIDPPFHLIRDFSSRSAATVHTAPAVSPRSSLIAPARPQLKTSATLNARDSSLAVQTAAPFPTAIDAGAVTTRYPTRLHSSYAVGAEVVLANEESVGAAAPTAPPFTTKIRLKDIALDCGALTADEFERHPRGQFGMVLCGTWRGIRIAVKILASRYGVAASEADDDFRSEADNLLAVRSLIDRANVLVKLGQPLFEACDRPDPARRCRNLHNLSGYRHLVFVYGVGTEPDLSAVAPGLPPGPAHLIVMEELTGGTLNDAVYVPGAPRCHLADLLQISTQLANGLVALEAAHVVHSDIKTDNMMFRTPGGQVVLTDYGVGRIANGGVHESMYDGKGRGHIFTRAPELLDGRHANTFASDVFSFSLSLWCLFSGRRQAWADASGAVPDFPIVVARVVLGERPNLSDLRSDTPPAISALIQSCWAPIPDQRPTAQAIASDLRDCEMLLAASAAEKNSAMEAAEDSADIVIPSSVRELLLMPQRTVDALFRRQYACVHVEPPGLSDQSLCLAVVGEGAQDSGANIRELLRQRHLSTSYMADLFTAPLELWAECNTHSAASLLKSVQHVSAQSPAPRSHAVALQTMLLQPERLVSEVGVFLRSHQSYILDRIAACWPLCQPPHDECEGPAWWRRRETSIVQHRQKNDRSSPPPLLLPPPALQPPPVSEALVSVTPISTTASTSPSRVLAVNLGHFISHRALLAPSALAAFSWYSGVVECARSGRDWVPPLRLATGSVDSRHYQRWQTALCPFDDPFTVPPTERRICAPPLMRRQTHTLLTPEAAFDTAETTPSPSDCQIWAFDLARVSALTYSAFAKSEAESRAMRTAFRDKGLGADDDSGLGNRSLPSSPRPPPKLRPSRLSPPPESRSSLPSPAPGVTAATSEDATHMPLEDVLLSWVRQHCTPFVPLAAGSEVVGMSVGSCGDRSPSAPRNLMGIDVASLISCTKELTIQHLRRLIADRLVKLLAGGSHPISLALQRIVALTQSLYCPTTLLHFGIEPNEASKLLKADLDSWLPQVLRAAHELPATWMNALNDWGTTGM